MRDELKQRQNECSRLRALLATRAKAMEDGGSSADNSNKRTMLNEDGELEMAYKTQQELNKYKKTDLWISIVQQ